MGVLVCLFVLGTFADLAASPAAVFGGREYWRAWSALFAHADPAHLLSNLLLFIPFAFALTRHYSLAFFPVAGFFVGGLMNFLVLRAMPTHHSLVGASGVVYWMGAAWVTLSILVDRREKTAKRVLKGIGVSMLLFLPETYRPEVSYYAHFLGYVSGVASALVYYAFNRERFHAAEVYETVLDFNSLIVSQSIFYPVEASAERSLGKGNRSAFESALTGATGTGTARASVATCRVVIADLARGIEDHRPGCRTIYD